MTLTGRTRYRQGWRGRLVLQLEYEFRYLPAGCRPAPGRFAVGHEWRDATIDDVLALTIAAAPAPPAREDWELPQERKP